MENINLVYIDDNIDPHITSYFLDDFTTEKAEIQLAQIHFKSSNSYEDIINNELVMRADVIIIDSKLFENARIIQDKLTGEELRIIIKKIFPYKEVIVITQNDIDDKFGVIPKFDKSKSQDQKDFYDINWKPLIESAIRNVLIFRKLSEKLELNRNIERVLVEQILDSLNGTAEYEKLTANDIDKLVESFESIKRGYCD